MGGAADVDVSVHLDGLAVAQALAEDHESRWQEEREEMERAIRVSQQLAALKSAAASGLGHRGMEEESYPFSRALERYTTLAPEDSLHAVGPEYFGARMPHVAEAWAAGDASIPPRRVEAMDVLLSPGAKRKARAGLNSTLSELPAAGGGAPPVEAYHSLLEPGTLSSGAWELGAGAGSGAVPVSNRAGVLYRQTKRRLESPLVAMDDVDVLFEQQLERERALRAEKRGELEEIAARRVDAEVEFIHASVAHGDDVALQQQAEDLSRTRNGSAAGPGGVENSVNLGDGSTWLPMQSMSTSRVLETPLEPVDPSVSFGVLTKIADAETEVKAATLHASGVLARGNRVVPGTVDGGVDASGILSVHEWEMEQKALVDASTTRLATTLEAETDAKVAAAKEAATSEATRALEARSEEVAYLRTLPMEDRVRYLERQMKMVQALQEELAADELLLSGTVPAEPELLDSAADRVVAIRKQIPGPRAGLLPGDDLDDAYGRLQLRAEWLRRQRLIVLLQEGDVAANRQLDAALAGEDAGSLKALTAELEGGEGVGGADGDLDAAAIGYDYAELVEDGGALMVHGENEAPPRAPRPLPTPPPHVPRVSLPLVGAASGRALHTHREEAELTAGLVSPSAPAWRGQGEDQNEAPETTRVLALGAPRSPRKKVRVRKRREKAAPQVGMLHDPSKLGVEQQVVRSQRLAVRIHVLEADERTGQMVPVRSKRKASEPDGVVALRLGKARVVRLMMGLKDPVSSDPLLDSLVRVRIGLSNGPVSKYHDLETIASEVTENGTHLVATVAWPETLDRSLGWTKPCATGERRSVPFRVFIRSCDPAGTILRLPISFLAKVYPKTSKIQRGKSFLEDANLNPYQRITRVNPRVGVFVIDAGFDVSDHVIALKFHTRDVNE